MTLVGPDAALAHVRAAEADLRAAGRLTGILDFADRRRGRGPRRRAGAGGQAHRLTVPTFSPDAGKRFGAKVKVPHAGRVRPGRPGRRRTPRAHRAQPGGPHRDPRHVPAAEPEPALHHRVAAQVVDAAAGRVVDVEHPVAVAGQHEHDVPRGHARCRRRAGPARPRPRRRRGCRTRSPGRPRRRRAARRACTACRSGRRRTRARAGRPTAGCRAAAATGTFGPVPAGEEAVRAAHHDPLVGGEPLRLGGPARRARRVRLPGAHPRREQRVDEHPGHGEARRAAGHRGLLHGAGVAGAESVGHHAPIVTALSAPRATTGLVG